MMFKVIFSILFVAVLMGCESSVEKQGLKEQNGMKLVAVKKGSVYDRLGLKEGDLILQYNDTTVRDGDDVSDFYSALKEGESITITLLRNGETKKIESALPVPSK